MDQPILSESIDAIASLVWSGWRNQKKGQNNWTLTLPQIKKTYAEKLVLAKESNRKKPIYFNNCNSVELFLRNEHMNTQHEVTEVQGTFLYTLGFVYPRI